MVVCTYNGAETIRECLNSLVSQNIPKEEYEILVVDDGSTDNTKEIVKELMKKSKNLRLISKKHEGLSVARNIGFRQARGDIILYTDDDSVADSDWVSRIAKAYEPEVVGVGGYMRPYEKNVWSLYEFGRQLLNYGINAEKIDFIGGLNMSFKKEALEKIGGFDPIFACVADDADISRRFISKGYKLKVIPAITVPHKSPSTLKDFCKKKISRGAGHIIFKKKYNPRYSLARSIIEFILLTLYALKRGMEIGRIVKREDLRTHFMILSIVEHVMMYIGSIYECFKYRNLKVG